ncbi:MAG: Bax inhibitor-1/YccA family protein [Muribaculaceae bacterium]|nr:Bax inhibitor-1/YccA family protein [Muribaculaceae bacterium]MDE5930413.1 Bax inhibitor-1/YccA family protein [Muribaculaceae bacterium]MDE6131335.1 Bax inhibitor-1/YccA family protein [Muribaculaceae bacterium]
MNDYKIATPPRYVATGVSAVMKQVYLKMTLGLLITAFISLFCAGSYAYLSFIASNSWFMWVLLGAELLIVFSIGGALNKLGTAAGFALFLLFSVINGLALTPIFLIYTTGSIVKTFFITAGTFGAMSVYGYFTNKDLSKMGSILFMALIGLIIASLVNIFAHSSTLDWIISIAGVIIFVGLTAWDTQQIRRMAEMMPGQAGRVSTLGALNLYLDFINLFLYLLRFFGSSRD